MKKLILTLGAMVVSTGLFAQGYITMANGNSTQVDTNMIVSPFFGGPGGGWSGTNSASDFHGGFTSTTFGSTYFYVALLTQPYSGSLTADTNVFDGTWQYTSAQTTDASSGQPGKIVGLNDVTVSNWGVNVTQQFILAAWTANLGATWAIVSNELASGNFSSYTSGTPFFGVSAVSFEAAQPAPSAPAATLWSALLGPQSYGNPISSGIAMYIVPIPEPGSLALAGLGGLSLLLFRRQRK